MPLFFLLGGYFTKTHENVTQYKIIIRKNFNRLVVPYIFTSLLLVIWALVLSFFKDDYNIVIRQFLSSLIASDYHIKSRFGDLFVGPMWFLLALFWAKTAFLFISKFNKTIVLVSSISISIVATLINIYVIHIPWSILLGLSSLIFVSIGWWCKNNIIPLWIKIVVIICWPITILISRMDMRATDYMYYPLDVLGACGGTLSIYWLSLFIKNKLQIVSKILVWCGVSSLAILCFHAFELHSKIAYKIINNTSFVLDDNEMIVFRYGLTFLMVIIALNTPYIKKIFIA